MTSPVNYVDPTGHKAMHNPGGGSSEGLVPVPEPEPTPGTSSGGGSEISYWDPSSSAQNSAQDNYEQTVSRLDELYFMQIEKDAEIYDKFIECMDISRYIISQIKESMVLDGIPSL